MGRAGVGSGRLQNCLQSFGGISTVLREDLEDNLKEGGTRISPKQKDDGLHQLISSYEIV